MKGPIRHAADVPPLEPDCQHYRIKRYCFECKDAEIARLQSDLAAHKAALADVVERAAQVTDASAKICDEEGKPGPALYFRIASSKIRSLAPPDAAPYAKVLEIAKRIHAASHAEHNARGVWRIEEQSKFRLAVEELDEALAGIVSG